METFYWIGEYSKVFLGYLFLMYVWPMVVFGRFLRGRGVILRFSFCVTAQILLVNTVVLLSGLFHILSPWLLRFLFYGVFVWSVLRKMPYSREGGRAFKRLLQGTCGWKLFAGRMLGALAGSLRRGIGRLLAKIRVHLWEYLLLGILVLYGMIYFSYGAFCDYSFGSGDMYPHNQWIYGLTQGQIFSAGVYPEGMHCFIYALHTLFGIKIYSCLLFVAGIHVSVFLLSVYLFLREIFRWRFTPMLVLAGFLTIDLVSINEVYSMARLQWTIPQEFALFTPFLCGTFLIRYLRGKGKPLAGKRFLWDENLLLFALSLAVSLAVHFYPTIMAFFLCICVVPVFLSRIFSGKYFFPLAAAVFCGFAAAVIPMAGALACGYEFQGSIGWAMEVIRGEDEKSQETSLKLEEGEGKEETSVLKGEASEQAVLNEAIGQGDSGNSQSASKNRFSNNLSGEEDAQRGQQAAEGFSAERISEAFRQAGEAVRRKLQALYTRGYRELYGQKRAEWIRGFTLLAFALWLVYRMAEMVLKKISRNGKSHPEETDGWLVAALASVVFMGMYCARALGLPALIEGARLCSVEQLLILAVMAVPADLLFTLLSRAVRDGALQAVSVLCTAGIYAGTILTGTFHGYLYYELTRYNGAVLSACSVVDTLPEESYTIVSTTDELYQVIQYGWHEELIDFVNQMQTAEYRLPSEYVFLFVEKRPIERSQIHYFTGPGWLACEKYAAYHPSRVSQCPEIAASEIKEVRLNQKNRYFANHSNSYADLEIRREIESLAYEWCREFAGLYPGELKTYYEDESFVCYYFRQNVNSLYQLAIGAGEEAE